MFKRVFIALILATLLTSAASGSELKSQGKEGGCKSTTQTVGTCSVSISVCYGFYKLHWKYTASACTNGQCASANGHFDSADGAAESAVQALIALVPSCV